MKTLAAVLVETGRPLILTELEIPSLRPGQVLVEIARSGVCHTQLLECRGYRGEDRFLPHGLGHEGSGVVREIGPGVTRVKPGDRVILSWMKGSGQDIPATTYRWNSRDVNAGGITTFSKDSVISENRLTVMPPGLDMESAALLGCAAPTGFGVIVNTARPLPGQSLVVFGIGGIGLCAVGAAVLAGCAPVIAVDIRADKLDKARLVGAHCTIDGSNTDVPKEIERMAPKGVDFAVEATGRPAVMVQALQCVRHQGGTAVVVGNARHGDMLTLDPRQLNMGKRLLGTWGGDNVPDRDFPKYCGWLLDGKITLSPLMERQYPLAHINQALDDLERGACMRPLINMFMD